MKKTILAFLLISTGLFFACKKSGNNAPAPSAKTQWTIAGNTYFGLSTVFDPDTLETDLTSTDSLGNNVIITFHARPVKNGTYAVVLDNIPSPSGLGANQCEINVLIINNGNNYYVSSGVGGNVTVTVMSGKITAVLTNVGLENIDLPQDVPTVSGTLHEQ